MTATAWHRLVDRHLGLALSAARKARANGESEDLEGEAKLALCEVACGWTGTEERFAVEAAARANRAVADALRRSQVGTAWRARAQQDGRALRRELEAAHGDDGFRPLELAWAGSNVADGQVTMVPVGETDWTCGGPDEALEAARAEEEHLRRWRSLPAADRALLEAAALNNSGGGASMAMVAAQVGEPRDAVAGRIGRALGRLITPA